VNNEQIQQENQPAASIDKDTRYQQEDKNQSVSVPGV
jgi:hypothetical protein